MNTVKPLVDALASGVIRGVVGVVGCNNAKTPSNYKHLTVMKELIKNDYLVAVSYTHLDVYKRQILIKIKR